MAPVLGRGQCGKGTGAACWFCFSGKCCFKKQPLRQKKSCPGVVFPALSAGVLAVLSSAAGEQRGSTSNHGVMSRETAARSRTGRVASLPVLTLARRRDGEVGVPVIPTAVRSDPPVNTLSRHLAGHRSGCEAGRNLPAHSDPRGGAWCWVGSLARARCAGTICLAAKRGAV